MAVEYSGASREAAQEIADALTRLDDVLAAGTFDATAADDLAALRARVRRELVSVRTDLQALGQIDADDVFKTNPVFATQRYQIITSIEQTRIDFEFEVVPALQKFARQNVDRAKQHSSSERADGWTPRAVLESAERLVDDSTRAVSVVSKATALIRAFMLLAGLAPI